MLAMQLSEPRPVAMHPLRASDLDPPRPGPGELLLRVSACGVCRTDLQLVEGELGARRLPIVPGHQIVGRVEAVGAGVTGWEEGSRAGIAWLASTCGTCSFCREGRENLCVQARFTGWDIDGGYATHATVRADFALRIPVSFDDVSAAPLLCGGVIGYRALRRSRVRPGGRLGLFGFGASATIAVQIAVFWGCRVFVFTRSERERERARELGAEWAGGYEEQAPERLDAAVTFAPVGCVVVAALERLERGGTVAVNAIHLDRIPAFSYDALWWERELRSVANFTRDDARSFLELAARIPVKTRFDVYPLADANVALQRLAAGDVAGAVVLKT
jgi:alcohol dehydrogenase, propanol-preferring